MRVRPLGVIKAFLKPRMTYEVTNAQENKGIYSCLPKGMLSIGGNKNFITRSGSEFSSAILHPEVGIYKKR